MKNDKRHELIEHLNSMDFTGGIKFTDEPETEGSIPFLDALISCKGDDSVCEDTGILKKSTYRSISSIQLPPSTEPHTGSHQNAVQQVQEYSHGTSRCSEGNNPCEPGSVKVSVPREGLQESEAAEDQRAQNPRKRGPSRRTR